MNQPLPHGISVVIPCYCSEGSLGLLVDKLVPVLESLAPGAHEVLLVVDGSPDDTWAVAQAAAATYPGVVRAVLLMRNYGQHNALLAGVHRARYDVVVTMDDDLQHPPDQVPILLEALEDPELDIVYGVAHLEEHGPLRSLASRSVKAALSAAGVPSARDVSAFRAFRTRLREAFSHASDPYASLDVWLSWATTAVGRRPVTMERRTVGRSSYTPRRLVRHAFNMITGFSEAPLRLVLYLGLLCAGLGALLLIRVVVAYFTGTTKVAGFTTIAAMVSLFSGAQMLSLGILGEYISRLHARSMTKPTYVVRHEAPEDAPR